MFTVVLLRIIGCGMATYKQIQEYVRREIGKVPKSCWIAHCKELYGLPVRKAYNRQNVHIRQVPCNDPKMKSAIRKAFEHFGML